MKAKTRGIFIGILLTLVAVVMFQNTKVFTLQFLIWEIGMPQIILIPLVLGAGFVIGFVVGKKSW